jgi:glycosyltransferase involved in cell wall biosynthesis
MKIAWFVNDERRGMIRDVSSLAFGTLASIRYRVGLPALALAPLGVESIVFSLDDRSRLSPPQYAGVGAAIFSKISDSPARFAVISDANLMAAHQLKQEGIPVIVDVCDNHFEDQDCRNGFIRELIGFCDLVVTNTRWMANIVREKTGKAAVVIGDPCETLRATPHFSPRKPIRILWFGHPSNLKYLNLILPGLISFSREFPVAFHVSSIPKAGLVEDFARITRSHQSTFSVTFIPWQAPKTTWRMLKECDLVIIPGDPRDPKKMGASNNRLTDSLWAGRFVVASPMDSYLEFADTAWISDDLIAGIRWALAHPQEVLARIAAAQERIAARYSKEGIGRQWLEVLQAATKQVAGSAIRGGRFAAEASADDGSAS